MSEAAQSNVTGNKSSECTDNSTVQNQQSFMTEVERPSNGTEFEYTGPPAELVLPEPTKRGYICMTKRTGNRPDIVFTIKWQGNVREIHVPAEATAGYLGAMIEHETDIAPEHQKILARRLLVRPAKTPDFSLSVLHGQSVILLGMPRQHHRKQEYDLARAKTMHKCRDWLTGIEHHAHQEMMAKMAYAHEQRGTDPVGPITEDDIDFVRGETLEDVGNSRRVFGRRHQDRVGLSLKTLLEGYIGMGVIPRAGGTCEQLNKPSACCESCKMKYIMSWVCFVRLVLLREIQLASTNLQLQRDGVTPRTLIAEVQKDLDLLHEDFNNGLACDGTGEFRAIIENFMDELELEYLFGDDEQYIENHKVDGVLQDLDSFFIIMDILDGTLDFFPKVEIGQTTIFGPVFEATG